MSIRRARTQRRPGDFRLSTGRDVRGSVNQSERRPKRWGDQRFSHSKYGTSCSGCARNNQLIQQRKPRHKIPNTVGMHHFISCVPGTPEYQSRTSYLLHSSQQKPLHGIKMYILDIWEPCRHVICGPLPWNIRKDSPARCKKPPTKRSMPCT